MAALKRSLLIARNGKMGQFICHFDLPPVKTCPGRSSLCEHYCYASHGRFATRRVKRRLRWLYRQSLKTDFVPRLVAEIKKKGVLVFRWHVAGDVYCSDYAWKMLEVMQACPKVRFYLYSRSWRSDSIRPALEEMARLPNCQVWWSCDQETGEPEAVPEGVKLCFMQHAPEAVPQRSQLLFRTRNMRRQPKIALPVLQCPQESRAGDVTCGGCQYCFR